MQNLKVLLQVFRFHHWIKNLLLFMPLVTAHQFYNLDLILLLCVAFLSFSFCASSIYIFNDMLDIEHDKAHPKKRTRPFASNNISIDEANKLWDLGVDSVFLDSPLGFEEILIN